MSRRLDLCPAEPHAVRAAIRRTSTSMAEAEVTSAPLAADPECGVPFSQTERQMTSTESVKPRRSFVATALGVLSLLVRDAPGTAGQVQPSKARIPRRIVTGVDGQGRSRVESDSPLVANVAADRPVTTDFWVARKLPAVLNGPLEPTSDWKGGNEAPAGGAIGRLLTWPAGFSYPRHTTPSLDFIMVVSGALELLLDTESKVLNAGDVVVQRGTAHAWRVAGSEPCTFVGIMLDAKPDG